MRKIMLGLNAYDVAAADAAFKADIEALQAQGKLEAIYTHMEDGELAVNPFERDIGQAEAVERRRIGTGVSVRGVDHFVVDMDLEGSPTRCFHIVRMDGSRVDFSYPHSSKAKLYD